MIAITLPDGTVKEVSEGTSSLDVAMSISEGWREMCSQLRSMVKCGSNEAIHWGCDPQVVDFP